MSRGARACCVRLSRPVRGGAVRLLACLLLLTAGCLKNRHVENDPLVGGPLPGAGSTGGSTAVAAGTGPDPAAGQPPMHAPTSTTSAAALANGVIDQQLEPGSALRIIGNTPGQGQPGGVLISRPQPLADPGNAGFPTTSTPTGGNGFETMGGNPALDAAVALTGQVEPVRGTGQPSVPLVTPGPAPGPGSAGIPVAGQGGLTHEQLFAALQARGATDISLQQVPNSNDGWACLCSLPGRHPTEPGYDLRVNVQAPGEHGLAALRAAVDEIDSKLQTARTGRQ